MTEPTNEVKRLLIENEMNQHEQAAYVLGVRYRVSKKIGASPEELKPIEDALVKTEKMLDALKAELEQLE